MTHPYPSRLRATLFAACALASTAAAQLAQDSRFTYQGELLSQQSLFSGAADFRFTLFNTETGGSPLATTVQADHVAVSSGRFSVPIDFGTVAFQGQQAWLEIAVRAPAGTGTFVTLGTRQQITSAPYASLALDANRFGGQTP